MKQSAKKLDLYAIEWATSSKKVYKRKILELADNLINDPEKKKRLSEALCPMCFYDRSRIGGAAMTTRPCAECGKEMMFSNTCTDILCLECATLLKLCKHCGAMVNYTRPIYKPLISSGD